MRVLIVAYYFPPKGGAGTQRFAKFCKYLPEHGIETVVLTVTEAEQSEHAPHDDASLEHGDCRVERVAPPARPPLALRLRRRLRLHVDADEWAWAAEQRALELARGGGFDAVITTLSPYACYRIGQRLQRELQLPWIADLRDPWALDAWRVSPSPLHARRDLAQLTRTLRSAAVTIANVPEARRAFVALGADPARTVVIPNGFDDDDFAGPPPPRSDRDQPLRLIHIGTFHPASLPAGMTRSTLRRVRQRQIEPLGRTGFYLLQALSKWRDLVGHQRAVELLRLHLYGEVDASHRELIERLGVTDLVERHGYRPHRESVQALRAADVAFVPLHGVPAGERALVVPGKLYEALASERHVLGALPPGDGADLIRATGAGTVVPPTDAARLADALGDLVDRHRGGETLAGCARTAIGGFSRRDLTGRLAHVVRAAARGERAVSLPELWPAPESA